jgi:hypothetical protein
LASTSSASRTDSARTARSRPTIAVRAERRAVRPMRNAPMQMSCTSTSAAICPVRSRPTGCTIERSAMTPKIMSRVTVA